MTTPTIASAARHSASGVDSPRYKWVALSNTTLGMLLATINQSIILIALPDIFDGIKLNPLQSGNTSYLLWMMMGFMVVTAVLVVAFGRLGDMFGRVKMYNFGFVVFTICSVLLAVTWMHGTPAAWWLIGWRVVQGIGGAFLMANSTAILTDAFPAHQRGTALGINAIAAVAGSFIGLLVGGVLAPHNWHYIFLVSVPVGVFGTIWAYLKLRDNGVRRKVKMDWWGNATFAIGLIAVLVGITYGIQPYGSHTMGWSNPQVIAELGGGVLFLIAFVIIETKVAEPLFRLGLFRNRAFAFGNISSLLMGLGRGGLQFILIIWLQGIWLPQHGYSFSDTPLWAGIYMVPMTIGFLIAAPLSGILSDRLGTRWFTIGGPLLVGVTFVFMMIIPTNFNYWVFAVLLIVNGIGSAMFISPNRADIMNNVPADQRGVGAGMTGTFMNAATVLSIGIFFSLIVAGLSHSLPSALYNGLTAQHVGSATATGISKLPPLGVLFAAFLGYNPMKELLGSSSGGVPAANVKTMEGHSYFPHLITQPFHDGLAVAFWFAIIACVIASLASVFIPRQKKAERVVHESLGSELAATAGEETFGVSELVAPHMVADDGGGEVIGLVTTATGAPAPGVTVTALNAAGEAVATTVTGATGQYTMFVPDFGDHIIVAAGMRSDAVPVDVTPETAPVSLRLGS